MNFVILLLQIYYDTGDIELKKTTLACVVLLLMLVAGCDDDRKQSPTPTTQTFINIATGGAQGTYQPLGMALADILNKEIPGINASAQMTSASVINIDLLSKKKVEIAFTQSDIAYYAFYGIEMFDKNKISNIKGLISLYPETLQIITNRASGIKTIDDIKGKRVAVGAAGSGTEANARKILNLYGISFKDIDVQYLSFNDSSSGLKNQTTDVVFATAGYPTLFIEELLTKSDVVLLPIEEEKLDILVEKYPFYSKQVIPANTYAGQDKPVSSLSVMAILAVNDKIDDELGYKITKVIFANIDKLKAAHDAGKEISIENAKKSMTLPFNKGAENFLNSK